MGFRDYQVAAPLKLLVPAFALVFADGFRDYQVAAPLKRTLSPGGVREGEFVSATIKSRPH